MASNYLSIAGLCAKLDVSDDTLRRHYLYAPGFPVAVIGNRWKETEVEAWLDANRALPKVQRRKSGNRSKGSSSRGARSSAQAP